MPAEPTVPNTLRLNSAERPVAMITAICFLLFAAVAVVVTAGFSEAIDRELLLAFRAPGDPSDPWGPAWFEEAAAEITTLGGYTILSVVVAVVSGTLLILRKFEATVFLLAAVGTGSIVSTLAKQVFDRARPALVDHLDPTFTSSFPSAHAMVSAFTWMTLVAIASRFVESPALRGFLISGAIVICVVVGISRVYLGVHWPSDVVAGWFFGGGWAGLCWLTANRFARRMEDRDALGESE